MPSCLSGLRDSTTTVCQREPGRELGKLSTRKDSRASPDKKNGLLLAIGPERISQSIRGFGIGSLCRGLWQEEFSSLSWVFFSKS